MMMSLLAVFAEFEAKQISARTLVSNDVRRQQGRALGLAPYGFAHRHDEQGAWRIVHPDEAKAVKPLVKWTLAGDALRETARKANEAGLPLRRTKVWTGESVAAVLRNPAINGQRPKGDDVERGTDGRPTRDKALQIVDNATWRDLQAALRQRSAHRFDPTRHAPLLLADVVKCATCGGPMTRSGAGKGYQVYRCSNGVKRKCRRPVTIGVLKLETFIDDFVALVEHVELPVIRHEPNPALEAELAEITENVERILGRLATASAVEVGALAAQLTRLREQQAVIVNRIETETIEVTESLGYSPAIAWREGDDEVRRSLVPLFFQSIRVLKAAHNATPVEDRLMIYTPLADGSGEGSLVWHPGCTMPVGAFAASEV